MLKQPASGVLIIREAYLASVPPPILKPVADRDQSQGAAARFSGLPFMRKI